jgi:hypothetical protein
MYYTFRQSSFDLSYTLQEKKQGKELLIFAEKLALPEIITINKRTSKLEIIL